MKRFWFLVLIMLFVGVGCAQRKTTGQADTQLTAEQQKAAADAKAAEKVTDQSAGQKVTQLDANGNPINRDAAAMDEEKSRVFQDIHFDYDKYEIREDAKPALKSLANYLIKNNLEKIVIEGNCDERGTNEYNLALGDRRAKATMGYLVAAGIASSRIETISYGEEKPLCKEQTEECWAKNRRSHFIARNGSK